MRDGWWHNSTTGDVSASGLGCGGDVATVNSNVGTFGAVTVNGKGLVTGAGPLTGDVSSSGAATTLATVNSNVGSFSNANITVNSKGLITAASSGTAGPTSQSGTFTLTGTGFSGTAPTSTATWSLVGNLVTLNLGNLGGTSNAVTFTAMGLPTFLQPATLAAQEMPLALVANGGTLSGGIAWA